MTRTGDKPGKDRKPEEAKTDGRTEEPKTDGRTEEVKTDEGIISVDGRIEEVLCD